MQNTKIIIKTKSKSYPVYFGNETLNRLRPLIRKKLPNVKKYVLLVIKIYLQKY